MSDLGQLLLFMKRTTVFFLFFGFSRWFLSLHYKLYSFSLVTRSFIFLYLLLLHSRMRDLDGSWVTTASKASKVLCVHILVYIYYTVRLNYLLCAFIFTIWTKTTIVVYVQITCSLKENSFSASLLISLLK